MDVLKEPLAIVGIAVVATIVLIFFCHKVFPVKKNE
jgi:hypothetical protein